MTGPGSSTTSMRGWLHDPNRIAAGTMGREGFFAGFPGATEEGPSSPPAPPVRLRTAAGRVGETC